MKKIIRPIQLPNFSTLKVGKVYTCFKVSLNIQQCKVRKKMDSSLFQMEKVIQIAVKCLPALLFRGAYKQVLWPHDPAASF